MFWLIYLLVCFNAVATIIINHQVLNRMPHHLGLSDVFSSRCASLRVYLHHLVKVVAARFLHWKITVFLFPNNWVTFDCLYFSRNVPILSVFKFISIKGFTKFSFFKRELLHRKLSSFSFLIFDYLCQFVSFLCHFKEPTFILNCPFCQVFTSLICFIFITSIFLSS